MRSECGDWRDSQIISVKSVVELSGLLHDIML